MAWNMISLEGSTALAKFIERNKKEMEKNNIIFFIDYTQGGFGVKTALVYVKTANDGKLT